MHFKLLNAGQEDGDRSADAMNPLEAYAASATAIETLHQEMMEKDKERLVEEEACCVCGETVGVMRCGGCKVTRYCSVDCQTSHRPYHAQYCCYIPQLIKIEKAKMLGGKEVQVRQGQQDVKIRRKMVKLVGQKPMLQCFYGGRKCEVLWDTGSMVSMVDRRWVNEHFPEQKIHSVEEFLGSDLHLQAANSSTIKFDGVVVMEFSLKEGEEGFMVSLLVSSSEVV